MSEVPQVFNIYCRDTCIVHLHALGLLGGNIAQPGILMEFVLDFLKVSSEQERCAKVSVSLVSEETLLRPREQRRRAFTRQVFESSEITLSLERCSFTFNVPRDAHPSFETNLVRVRWRMEFAFDLADGSILNWNLPLNMALLS